MEYTMDSFLYNKISNNTRIIFTILWIYLFCFFYIKCQMQFAKLLNIFIYFTYPREIMFLSISNSLSNMAI